MPFKRPTLTDIINRDTSDFEFELGSKNARLPATPEHAFVRAHAGVVHGLYGRLDNVALNAFVDTCEDERLIKMAAFFGVFQIPAKRATGEIYFWGNAGVVIPKGTLVVRSDGVRYETTVEDTITEPPGFVAIPARAVVAGAAGNDPGPNSYTLVNPIGGAASYAEPKTPFITGGWDAETTLSLRMRLKYRLANPPNAGGPGSYIAWAKEVGGVTRVWEFGKIDDQGNPKLGWVTVLFMRDDDTTGDPPTPDPFPGVPEVAEVKAKILEYAPLHLAGLHVQAPIDKPVSLTIEITPDTAAIRAAVVEAIQDMLAERANPPKADGATFYKSNFYDALADVDGLDDYKITVPAGDLTVDQFELLTIDAALITWV